MKKMFGLFLYPILYDKSHNMTIIFFSHKNNIISLDAQQLSHATMKRNKWFKTEVVPQMEGFELTYAFLEDSDFGPMNHVEFNSESAGGEIDFWETGCLAIHFVDYLADDEMINVLWMPEEKDEQQKSFMKLLGLLLPRLA